MLQQKKALIEEWMGLMFSDPRLTYSPLGVPPEEALFSSPPLGGRKLSYAPQELGKSTIECLFFFNCFDTALEVFNSASLFQV
jgi:hypothetical protein